MLKYRKFSDDDIKKICKNIVLLIDTREKNFENVTSWCDYKNRCKYKRLKLDNGDYSFMLKAMPEYGINDDLYFDKDFVIEKKNSLDEISANFTKHRTRFEEELATFKGKMIIVIEDSWDNLFTGNYNSNYNRVSFIGSVMAFEQRYGVNFRFMSNEAMPVFICTQCFYYLRSILKGEQ